MPVDDNARKFIVSQFDPENIAVEGTLSYYMDVYWTDTAEDSETKVVRKIFRHAKKDPQLLRIRKQKDAEGRRTSVKTPITEKEFDEVSLMWPEIPGLQKRRTELTVLQGDDEYVVKYDEFTAGTNFDFHEPTFFMAEVEPLSSVEEFDRQSYLDKFDPSVLFVVVDEVTGEPAFEGFRMSDTLKHM